MSLAQRVGQLLMVDCPTSGITPATTAAITKYAVGSIILDGTTYAGLDRTAAMTAQLEADNPSAAKLLIAADQEGGQVQRLRGPGFSTIPSALDQGGMDPAALQRAAREWGDELRRAGVALDLAPVLDTVPADSPGNAPIGDLDREYGHDTATVTAHGLAVARGLSSAGVDTAVKHFPGLGRVAGNTDLSSGVVDSVTTRHDAYIAPFAAAVRARVPFVMISTAVYTHIDPQRPAAFSPTVVTGMLRQDLGFTGVVITDDVGKASQVGAYSLGDRAVNFIAAGGDIVLTAVASQAGPMTSALIARAQRDPSFARLVDAAALRVLQAKQARGLLG
jgi:beta-N-acetylhexosaminidase